MHKISGPGYGNKTNPDKIVICLHGYGSNGDDLISLAPYLQRSLPDAYFVSPHAPFACDFQFAQASYQWFSMEEYHEDFFYQGILKATPYLINFINELLIKFNLKYQDIYLVGFSQGAMMSLYVAPRLTEQCAGIIAFSGALIKPNLLAKELLNKPRVLLVHGDQDQVVDKNNFDTAKETLQQLNFPLQSKLIIGMTHSINEQALSLAIDFLS